MDKKNSLVPYALNLPKKTLEKMSRIAEKKAIPPAVLARSYIVEAVAMEAH